MQRIGIFGGSFNPVHYGHLLLAESCREACALDEVWLIPAAVPPHKQAAELAPGKARLEMLQRSSLGSWHIADPDGVLLDIVG